MSTNGDDTEARIDVWVQEQLAASPAWSKEKWDTIVAILESNSPEGIGAAQTDMAREAPEVPSLLRSQLPHGMA
ncbi:hypothetical protein HXS80_11895 [Streptomyces sp. CB04723]|uniref:hypothetical protein n=1 Tax=Streptomyces TaxID=1883 RepID=UPI0015C4809B|nr:hypothetical protein [Streptomyces sp. CB04723]QLG32323.1 hypothetical protein HXS80_11895 [Streptomyces sp. CB04723]